LQVAKDYSVSTIFNKISFWLGVESWEGVALLVFSFWLLAVSLLVHVVLTCAFDNQHKTFASARRPHMCFL